MYYIGLPWLGYPLVAIIKSHVSSDFYNLETNKMNVFISWSGERSKAIAEIFRDWLPKVIQVVRPYFSPSDVEKGSRWNSEISKKLEECKMGIFIITKDNLFSPWLLFEAGAISKNVDNSKVCPILFGVETSDIEGPLTQFQASYFDKIEVKKILKSINNELGDIKLDEKILDEAYDTWWPKLESKIGGVEFNEKATNVEIREDRELLEEVLEIVRFSAKRFDNLSGNKSILKYSSEELEALLQGFMSSFELVFDWDWDYSDCCLRDDDVGSYISIKGTFLNPMVDDEGNNWGNRLGLLEAYRKLKDFMNKYEITYPELM
jgi:TIR domain